MSTAAGLFIALLTVLVLLCLDTVFKAIFWLADELREVIFDSDANVLWKIIFFIPWLVLGLIRVLLLVIGILCGASLAKDAIKWLKK